LDSLTAKQKLDIAQYVLHQIEGGIKRESIEFIGTKDFKPYKISDRFTDKTLKLRIEGETGLSWVFVTCSCCSTACPQLPRCRANLPASAGHLVLSESRTVLRVVRRSACGRGQRK
jgi:hypothetical protein